jgi:hypothetical protein
MKFYITLFGCLIVGVTGLIYIERTFTKKSELLVIQKDAINDSRNEIDTLQNELDSIKNTATEIRENNLLLQQQAQQLKLEYAQQALVKQRNECIVNQRNIQVVVRAYQNMNDLKVGAPLDFGALIGSGKYIRVMPKCSCGIPYTLLNTIPPIGTLVATCNHCDQGVKHIPPNFSDW